MENRIGRIERVPLREVWQNEARDFTPWLLDNIDVLCETLGLEMLEVVRELSTGNLNVDLVAQDEQGQTVIIENQVEKSDHRHLGQLLTYLSTLEASTAIWIVADARGEHIDAVSWLNKSGLAAFYLVQLEAIRIGDSLPAPMFTLMAGPSEELAESGELMQELRESSGRNELYRRFWEGLLERSRGRTSLFSAVSARSDSLLPTAARSRAGLSFQYISRKKGPTVALLLEAKPAEVNNEILRELMVHRDAIESDFGSELQWLDKPGKNACAIEHLLEARHFKEYPEDEWPELQDRMIEAMIRLEKALRPYLDQLSR